MILKIRDEVFYKKSKIILDNIIDIVESSMYSISVRGIHYRLLDRGIIQNTKKQYESISRLTTKARYCGLLDWDKVIDNTRGTYKTTSWDNIEESIKNTLKKYRQDRWKNTDYYIEVWAEKRTMTSLFYGITDKYDVNLTIGGGFNSASAIWDAVQRLYSHNSKKIIILYFGDYDPSGWFMSFDVEKRLKEFGLDIELKRILLNKNIVEKYKLPKAFDIPVKYKDGKITNKLQKDSRAKFFYESNGELTQVEMDALPENILIEYVENSISEYYDEIESNKIINVENKEKSKIKKILNIA